MAGSQQTFANADALLKDQYSEVAQSLLNTAHPLLEKVEKSKAKFVGRRVVFPVNVRRSPNVGARAETGSLPEASRSTPVECEVRSKQIFGRLELTTELMDSAVSDKGAFADGVKYEMESMIEAVKDDVNRQLHGNQIVDADVAISEATVCTRTGILGTITATASSATQTVRLPGTRYLKPGMRVWIGTTAEHAAGTAVTATVESVTNSTTVVFTASVSTVTDDYISRGDSLSGAYDNEMMGLSNIVSNADDDLQTVNTGTYPEWAANVLSNSGTLRDLSLELMQSAVDRCDEVAGEEPDLIVCHTSTKREYINLLTPDVRYAPRELRGGVAKLTFTGGTKEIEISCDKHAAYGKIYFVNTKHLKQFLKSDWGWMDKDGSVLSRVADKPAYEATYATSRNLGVLKRNAHTLLTDLNYSGTLY